MKNKIFLFSLILTVMIAFSGCSSTGFGNEDIMQPPKPTGDKAQIQQIVENKTSRNYSLVYPQKGDNRSAIIVKDLTGHGDDEAIALYRVGGDSTKTHVLFIHKKDSTWVYQSDFIIASTDVERVCFADVNGDGELEILVGYSIFNTAANQLYAYFENGKTIQQIKVGDEY
ncbi:MAG: VCBS repeat-containing protein, partial [Bacillota bacterium]|nr:VCBS repeat-containing protein [Bacillota bacterium]